MGGDVDGSDVCAWVSCRSIAVEMGCRLIRVKVMIAEWYGWIVCRLIVCATSNTSYATSARSAWLQPSESYPLVIVKYFDLTGSEYQMYYILNTALQTP